MIDETVWGRVQRLDRITQRNLLSERMKLDQSILTQMLLTQSSDVKSTLTVSRSQLITAQLKSTEDVRLLSVVTIAARRTGRRNSSVSADSGRKITM